MDTFKVQVRNPADGVQREIEVPEAVFQSLANLGASTKITNQFAGRKGNPDTGAMVPTGEGSATLKQIYAWKNAGGNKTKLYEVVHGEVEALIASMESGEVTFGGGGSVTPFDRELHQQMSKYARSKGRKAYSKISESVAKYNELEESNPDAYKYFTDVTNKALAEQEKALAQADKSMDASDIFGEDDSASVTETETQDEAEAETEVEDEDDTEEETE